MNEHVMAEQFQKERDEAIRERDYLIEGLAQSAGNRLRAEGERDEARAERDLYKAAFEKAQAFKTFVHKRLDDAGVPVDPEPAENAKHGCRIEGRLNWLIHGRNAQRKMNEATHAAYHDVSKVIHLPDDNGAEMLRKVAVERDALAAEAAMLKAALTACPAPRAPLYSHCCDLYLSGHRQGCPGALRDAALASPSWTTEWLENVRHERDKEWCSVLDVEPPLFNAHLPDYVATHDDRVLETARIRFASDCAKHETEARREARECALEDAAAQCCNCDHGCGDRIRALAPREPETVPAKLKCKADRCTSSAMPLKPFCWQHGGDMMPDEPAAKPSEPCATCGTTLIGAFCVRCGLVRGSGVRR